MNLISYTLPVGSRFEEESLHPDQHQQVVVVVVVVVGNNCSFIAFTIVVFMDPVPQSGLQDRQVESRF